MKKFLSIIFICFLALGFYGCNNDSDGDDEVDPAVVAYITTATTEINTYVDELDDSLYTDENWALISAKLIEVKGQIANATSIEDIDALVAAAKAYIDGVEEINPLDIKKAEYVTKLENLLELYDEEFYTETAWAGILEVVEEAKEEVAAATTEEALEAIYKATKSDIEGVPAKDEEIAAAASEAIIALDAEFTKYDSLLYHVDDYAKIRDIYDSAKMDILYATELEEVQEYLDEALADMAKVKKLVAVTYNNVDGCTWADDAVLEETYRPGTEWVLPVPSRKYQEFLGWYLTADFSGNSVTKITTADSDVNLYAKWDELTDEDYLSIYKDEQEAAIKEYLTTSKDPSKYNETVWAEVEAALEEAVESIQAVALGTSTLAEAKALVDAEVTAGKAALDAIEATAFTVTLRLNGGNWLVNNKEELTELFFEEYNAFATFQTTITYKNFYSLGNGYHTSYYCRKFFEANPQWMWLLDFIKDNCNPEIKEDIVLNNSSAKFRMELAGYFGAMSAETAPAGVSYNGSDYSAYANDTTFLDYLKYEEIEYVETTTLPIPLKVDHKFLGWYADEAFTGDPVTEVSEAVTLYAHFEPLTEEEKVQLYQEELMLELEAYALATKDQSKFTEEDWTTFLAKVEELQGIIDATTTNDEADAALVEAKVVVDEYKDSTYTVTYVLNGGYWQYASKEEMVNAFLVDFSTFLGRQNTIAVDNFFASSWTADGGVNRFFKAKTEWQWLLTYLATKCDPSVAGEVRIDGTSGEMSQVRIELHAYFNSISYSYNGFASGDYTNDANDLGFTQYFKQTEFGCIGLVEELPTPFNGDKVFAGWYDNAECTGDAVTSIEGETTLYAKWVDA